MDHRRWLVHGPDAMLALGEFFGQNLVGGEVIALTGDLGSGKTQWVKGLGEGLGVQTVINSPTFAIVKPHVGRQIQLQHVDLYRLESPEECEDLGLEDLISDKTVLAVEWAERYPALRKRSHVEIEFEFEREETVRCLNVKWKCQTSAALVEKVSYLTQSCSGLVAK